MRLEVEIRKKLGNFALNVSFSCEDNVTAILGASGSGKSMTLKCIAGIETPDAGRIVLNGKVLFDAKKKINLPPQKRHVGYMFQDYALFPHMTVLENIRIAKNGNVVEEEYLKRFQLLEIKDLYPAQLSGGQKQRTAMARMLAANPEVILLDEPFSALDSHMRWQMENEVKQILAQEAKPTIFVSHNRDEVYRFSEFAGIMASGTMTQVVPTKTLFACPRTYTAAAITGCKNITKAIKKGSNQVVLPDWGMELETSEEVPFESGYVGIRAHSFVREDPGYGEKNCIWITNTKVVEDPFEWEISFQIEGSLEWLQWRISKDLLKDPMGDLPSRLWIQPEKIMLLTD